MVEYRKARSPVVDPFVSVCIANYNGEKIIADCIDSIRSQRVDFGVEIIVHDDASADRSLALLEKDYPDLELILSPQNVGFCVANNRMVERARGQWILLLNNDAALCCDALESLVRAGEAGDGVFTLPQFDWESGALVDQGCHLDPFYNPVPNLDASITDVAFTIGACMFLSRRLWLELEGFPEWIESIGEDLFLCCKARLRGHSVRCLPISGYRHRQGVSFGGNRVVGERLNTTVRRRFLSERNKTIVLAVCTPTVLMWPLLITHLTILMLEAATLVLVKRDVAIFRDIYWAAFIQLWRKRGAIVATRRSVQRTRRISAGAYLRVFTWKLRKFSMLRRYGMPTIRS